MLAESVLTGIAYRDETYKSRDHHRLKMVTDDSWQDELIATEEDGDFQPKAERKGDQTGPEVSCAKATDPEVHQGRPTEKPPTKGSISTSVSPSLCIPRKEQYCEKLDLYRSWSGQSLYQNYPDLHIGGGHIADHMCDSGCCITELSNCPIAELSNGLVLLSEDFASGQRAPLTHLSSQVIKTLNGDEARERSITLHKEPLSNSMINIYMEDKVQELYKQFMEEELTRCGSLTHILMSNLLMSNVGEASCYQSQESHIEASKASWALWHSLAWRGFRNISHGSSDEFSTPNLQISKPLLERKSSLAQWA